MAKNVYFKVRFTALFQLKRNIILIKIIKSTPVVNYLRGECLKLLIVLPLKWQKPNESQWSVICL